MAEHDTSASPEQQPLTPEAFFTEKVAPQMKRRIEDLRRQILSLEQQVDQRVTAQATIKVVIEGEGGGSWYLNIDAGEMKVASEAAFAPLMTIYESRAYFDWSVSIASEAGLFGPSGQNTQNELTRSRIQRLKTLTGLLQFVFTEVPDSGERGELGFLLQLGEGERPDTPQTVLTMKAEDAQKMARGEINTQQAFMGGFMQVTGDMALAMQFGTAMM